MDFVHAALGTALSPAEVEALRGVIDRSGAHHQVEEVIGQLSGHATDALARAAVDDHARAVLHELATAVTDRAV